MAITLSALAVAIKEKRQSLSLGSQTNCRAMAITLSALRSCNRKEKRQSLSLQTNCPGSNNNARAPLQLPSKRKDKVSLWARRQTVARWPSLSLPFAVAIAKRKDKVSLCRQTVQAVIIMRARPCSCHQREKTKSLSLRSQTNCRAMAITLSALAVAIKEKRQSLSLGSQTNCRAMAITLSALRSCNRKEKRQSLSLQTNCPGSNNNARAPLQLPSKRKDKVSLSALADKLSCDGHHSLCPSQLQSQR